MWCLAFLVFIFMVAAVNYLSILVSGMPHLCPVPSAAISAFDFIGENTHSTISCTATLSFDKFCLNRVEHRWANDSFVITFYIILRNFAFILFHLFLKEVHCKFFLQKRIPFIFFVGEHPAHRLLIPHIFS